VHILTKGNTIIFKATLSSFGVLCKGEKREEKRGREKGRKEGDYRG
jgi:hypothetical protein